MISAPVTDGNIAILNVVSNKGYNTLANTDQSFAKTMNDISNQQKMAETTSDTKQMQTSTDSTKYADKDKQIQNDTQTGDERSTENVTKTEEPKEVTETVEEEDNISAEMKDAIKDAAKDVIEKIAEMMELSEEEIAAAMNALGMQMTDILDPGKLVDLVLELNQTDMLSLVTDEALYNTLQGLTTSLQDTLNGLLEEYGITQEMLEQACMDINAEMNTMDFSSLEQNLFNSKLQQEDMPKELEKPVPEENQETVIEETTLDGVDTEKAEKHSEHANQKGEDKSDMQQDEGHAEFQNFKLENTENATAPTIFAGTSKTPDTENIMRQIMDYMNVKVKEDLTEMEMQLHPASLGTVNLQIATRGGVVTAQFTVENEAVKNALESQVAELKNTLEEQGVKIEAVEVTVASHEFERNLSDQNDSQEKQQEVEGARAKSGRKKIINLNDFDSLSEIAQESDDAARIAMELMASNGNTLDMLA